MKKILLVVLILLSLTSICFGRSRLCNMTIVCGQSIMNITTPFLESITEKPTKKSKDFTMICKDVVFENGFGMAMSATEFDTTIVSPEEIASFNNFNELLKENKKYEAFIGETRYIVINGVKAKEQYTKMKSKTSDEELTFRKLIFCTDKTMWFVSFGYIDCSSARECINKVVNSIEIQ